MPYADKAKNDACKKRYAASARSKEMQRLYYVKHRDEKIAQAAAWRSGNREASNASGRRRYAANLAQERERGRRKGRAAYRAEPVAAITEFHKFRTRQMGNESPGVTPEQWNEILETFGHRCAYCLRAGKLEREHVIAVALGGLDEAENVVPACHTCNTRKRNRTMLEWALIGGATGNWVKSRRRRARLTGRAA